MEYVWVHLADLPVMLYEENVLWKIASVIGNPIKIDIHTLQVARGRYASVCIAVDLSKPLRGVVYVNGARIQVEYEGLDQICHRCGMCE